MVFLLVGVFIIGFPQWFFPKMFKKHGGSISNNQDHQELMVVMKSTSSHTLGQTKVFYDKESCALRVLLREEV